MSGRYWLFNKIIILLKNNLLIQVVNDIVARLGFLTWNNIFNLCNFYQAKELSFRRYFSLNALYNFIHTATVFYTQDIFLSSDA